MRKSSSGKLFMLKEDVSSAKHLTKFRVCAQELLVILPIKATARFFPPIKTREIPPVGLPSRRRTWGTQNRQNLMRTRSVYQNARNVS